MHLEKSIQDILVEEGLISPNQMADVLAMREDATEEVEDLLVRMGYITDRERLMCRALQSSLPHVDLTEVDVDLGAARRLKQSIATRHMAVVLDVTEFSASVAMLNPLDIRAIDEISHDLGVPVDPLWALQEQLRASLVRAYGNIDDLANLIGELNKIDEDHLQVEAYQEEEESPSGSNVVDMRGESEGAPAIKLANALIARAVKVGASDIHIEPGEKQVRVRFRVDGLLQEIMTVPKELQRPLLSRLKVIAGLDIAERRVPQDGRITMHMQEGSFDLRVATYPATYGEKIIIRVLNKGAISMKLTDLGFPADGLATLIDSAEQPQGLILINGPTGSGKTTTLYSILNHLNTSHRHIITIEDPVEYRLDGIVQGNVNAAAGLTFARGLRAMLRADPDVILVGESRDPETAGTAIEASLTGHLVLTSLHSNDAAAAVVRLTEMGIEPFLVGASVTCSVAQRLLRRICSHCQTTAMPDPAVLRKLGLPMDEYAKGEGCEKCNGTGYKGRVGIYEVMKVTPNVRKLIYENAPSSSIMEAAVLGGMMTMRDNAIAKVLVGQTTVEEVIRATPEEMS
jgi:type IV pilus assembly protein PilB